MGNQWWENEHTSTHMFGGLSFFLLVPHFCAFVQSFIRRLDSIRFFNVTKSDKKVRVCFLCVFIRCACLLIRVNANFVAYIYYRHMSYVISFVFILSCRTLYFVNFRMCVRVCAWAFILLSLLFTWFAVCYWMHACRY